MMLGRLTVAVLLLLAAGGFTGQARADGARSVAGADEGRLPGIVFVGDVILGAKHEMAGRLATSHWREGYIYHRATTLHPLERTTTPTRPGANLYTLVPARPDGRLTRITHLTSGEVFDPEPSWDGRRILFSMRRDGELWFHLYEIGSDGTGLVQLTDGPFNDVSGVYLPDGRIVFISDRNGYLEEYHEERTETLWIMNADGTGMGQLTFGPGTVYDPTVLRDGRILFSYWDVFMIDVPPVEKHETYLMTVRPDGTELRHLFGARQYRFFDRERHSGFSLTQAGELPDGKLLVLSELGPAVLDLRRGPEVAASLWPIFPGTTTIQLGGATHRVHLSPTGSRTTPYPLPDGRFLFSATQPGARDLGIYVCDPATRRVRLVFNDPTHSEYDARPILLRRRPAQLLASKGQSAGRASSPRYRPARTRDSRRSRALAWARPGRGGGRPVAVTGRARFVIADARRSDNPAHQQALQRARYFRLIESLYTAVTSSSHTNLATRILGVVPILPDGSAYFEAPAETPLFLEALDTAGNRILFDWNYPVTSVPVGSKQPLVEMATAEAAAGEVKACHGCHARLHRVPSPAGLAALARPPVKLERDVVSDILYRRNEPDEYRCQGRLGEAGRYRHWLDSPDSYRRRIGCQMLMAIEGGSRAEAGPVARRLTDQDVSVRRAAALALTRLGTLDQAEALLAALGDPDWQVRFHAASALEAITGCRPPAASGGRGTGADIGRAGEPAASYYRRLFDAFAGVAGLRRAIGQGPAGLGRWSAGPDAGSRDRGWFEAAGRLGRAAPPVARQLVRAALTVPAPPPVKFAPQVGRQQYRLEGRPPPIAAIRAAGWMRDSAAVPLLAPWLRRHQYHYHASEAALALGRIGTDQAVAALWQALRTEVPNRRVYIGRYLQHGPRPEEYTLVRGLLLAGATVSLHDVPLLIALMPGTFLEKPRFEDRLRPESQRVLIGRLMLERSGLRARAVRLLTKALAGQAEARDPLYQAMLKGINLERPFSEHGRPFPVVKRIEPEQALWLLGCLASGPEEVPQRLVVPYLTSSNPRERIDAAVLLAHTGFGSQAAEVLAEQVAKPYAFHEIMSIGKGRPDPNFRDKCYMVMALARHASDVAGLAKFADWRRFYRDIRYGLAVGLGMRGRTVRGSGSDRDATAAADDDQQPAAIALLTRLATTDPSAVVRRQARESLRAIQESCRLAGRPVPAVTLPPPRPFEAPVVATGQPPKRRAPPAWPGPVAIDRTQRGARPARSLDELLQAVDDGLRPENFRNLNNVNNQAPGAKHMMVRRIHLLDSAVRELCHRFPARAGPLLRRLLDTPYPFAHYLACRAVSEGGFEGLEPVLMAKLGEFAKRADTVGFYWAAEALARRRVIQAIEPLARFAVARRMPGTYGPIGMAYGYPAAKAIGRLAARTDHPEVQRLLGSDNLWLRAGVLSGLAASGAPGVQALLRQALQSPATPALIRAEAAVALHRLGPPDRPTPD